MFNSKKPEPTSPLAPSLSSSTSAFGTAPAASYDLTSSGAMSSKGGKASHSIVDDRLIMRGDLESDGDILVKGKVYGNIACKVLIIDAEAFVEGGITAAEVIVRGRAKGEIRAERVSLERSADVDCDIYQKTFQAEEGARIRGALKMYDDAPKTAATTSSTSAAKSASASTTPASTSLSNGDASSSFN